MSIVTNLAKNLTDSTRAHAGRVAVRVDNAAMTYRALDDASARVAGLLHERGLKPGDRVGIMLPNVAEVPVVYYRVLRAAGVVVPMNPLLKAREVADYLSDSGEPRGDYMVARGPRRRTGPPAPRGDYIAIKELIVDQEEKERLERGAEEELNRQFGDGTVQKVEVLQYGDEPVIEPGQVMVRVILTPTDEDPDETLHAFEKAHRAAIEDLRKKVARKMPFIGRVQFTLPAQPGERGHPVISMSISPPDRTAAGRNLTPVMARLDPRDVEVLDALITAGIVSNRAEGVRWALTRIRERPAYTQLRQHIGKIDELKAQL